MKIFIDTLGCAKNEYDSQVLAASLVERGSTIVNDAGEADILIVNTCGFIEDAKKESIERIFELAAEKGEKKKLIVTGCLGERYHKELSEEIPEADMIFGVNDYDSIPDILLSEENDARDTGSGSSDRVGCALDCLPYRRRSFGEQAPHFAYLKIAEGCYNACSFCAIPSIRGSFRSKKMEDCIREAEDLATQGVKELILIAQDTSQYGRDLYGEVRLPELLHKLCDVEGIEWIRLMYVYDNGITDELIDVIASEPKICKYIDMPIQHVSDNVLKLMRRRSTNQSIKEVISKLRERIPDVHIRTTLLVGFPGETQADIDELIEFIDTYRIDRLGAFAFSDEEGTPSFEMKGKIDEDIKQSRRDLVMDKQLAVSESLNECKIGSVMEVIVDECAELGAEWITDDADADSPESIYVGRTRYDSPEIDCAVTFRTDRTDLMPGDIVYVRIDNAYEYDLEGTEVKE